MFILKDNICVNLDSVQNFFTYESQTSIDDPTYFFIKFVFSKDNCIDFQFSSVSMTQRNFLRIFKGIEKDLKIIALGEWEQD